MRSASAIARSHHEKWDGSGYPDGLAGEDIPFEARIVTLADVYDALRSSRPYKEAIPHDQTVSIIVNGDGRTLPNHFDPALIEIIERHGDDFRRISETGDDSPSQLATRRQQIPEYSKTVAGNGLS